MTILSSQFNNSDADLTFSLGGGTLGTNGDTAKVVAWGRASRVRFSFGGVSVFERLLHPTGDQPTDWFLKVLLVRVTANSQDGFVGFFAEETRLLSSDAGYGVPQTRVETTADLTVANAILVEATGRGATELVYGMTVVQDDV